MCNCELRYPRRTILINFLRYSNDKLGMNMVSDARPYQFKFFLLIFPFCYIFHIRIEFMAVVWFGIQKTHLP